MDEISLPSDSRWTWEFFNFISDCAIIAYGRCLKPQTRLSIVKVVHVCDGGQGYVWRVFIQDGHIDVGENTFSPQLTDQVRVLYHEDPDYKAWEESCGAK